MINNGMRAIHPGEILREDYLIPLDLSVNALANALHVHATHLHEIDKERRSITPDTALRLVRYFGGDAQSWLRLQVTYDLRVVEQQALAAGGGLTDHPSNKLRANG